MFNNLLGTKSSALVFHFSLPGSCPDFLIGPNRRTASEAKDYCSGITDKKLLRFDIKLDKGAFEYYDSKKFWVALRKKTPFSFRGTCHTNFLSLTTVESNLEWVVGSPIVSGLFTLLDITNETFVTTSCDNMCFTTLIDESSIRIFDENCSNMEEFLCYTPCRKSSFNKIS